MSKILCATDAAAPQINGLVSEVLRLFFRRVPEILGAVDAASSEVQSVVSEFARALDRVVPQASERSRAAGLLPRDPLAAPGVTHRPRAPGRAV